MARLVRTGLPRRDAGDGAFSDAKQKRDFRDRRDQRRKCTREGQQSAGCGRRRRLLARDEILNLLVPSRALAGRELGSANCRAIPA